MALGRVKGRRLPETCKRWECVAARLGGGVERRRNWVYVCQPLRSSSVAVIALLRRSFAEWEGEERFTGWWR